MCVGRGGRLLVHVMRGGGVRMILDSSLCISKNSFICFDTMSLGLLIEHVKGSQVQVSKLRCVLIVSEK